MLADDALTLELGRIAEYERESEELGEELDAVHDEMVVCAGFHRRAHRFALSPSVASIVNDLADPKAVEKGRGGLFLPGEPCWIEWAGTGPSKTATRHGVLFSNVFDEALVDDVVFPSMGAMTYYTDEKDETGAKRVCRAAFYYAFADEFEMFSYEPISKYGLSPDAEDDEFARETFASEFEDGHPLRDVWSWNVGRYAAAALAFINTPRMVHRVPRDVRKPNIARIKRGKEPLLTYSEVTLRPDIVDVVRKETRSGTGEERAFHHVRGHLRLQQGKVALVRPHWRGNPEKGVRVHRHAVKVADDKGKKWDRDPLPDPVPLDPHDPAVIQRLKKN